MEEQYAKGMLPMVLLPAKEYVFKVSDNHYMIEVPRHGKYHDIDPEFFAEEDGEFNLMDDEAGVLFIPAITKVLFATKKYPALEVNQFFAPYYIKFEQDNVIIVGQLIEMLVASKGEKEEENE